VKKRAVADQGRGLIQIKPERVASSPLSFELDITVDQHVGLGSELVCASKLTQRVYEYTP
jgi:hypothetical protein